MKKYLIGAVFSIGILISPALALAQVQGDVAPDQSSSSCISLQYNLQYRSTDAGTNGEVSQLQDFLQSQGYLASEPTGYFGLLTQNAVKKFQSANGVLSSGYVGPITRVKINDVSCNGTNGKGTPVPTVSTTPTTSTLPVGCRRGDLYNSLTGQRCESTTLPLGCPPGALYNSRTGERCVPTPSTGLTASPTSGSAPLDVSFSVSGSRGIDFTQGYTIKFGDGSSGKVQIVGQVLCMTSSTTCNPNMYGASHNYASAGTYYVWLLDGSGQKIGNNATVVTVGGQTSGGITIIAPNGGEVLTENSRIVSSLSSVDSQRQIFEIKWSGAPDSFTDIYGDNASNPTRIAAYLEQNVNGQFNIVGRIIPSAYGSIMWIVGQVSDTSCLLNNNNSIVPQNHCQNSVRLVSPGNYYVKIVDTQTGATGRSNVFTIVATNTTPAPTITVVSPNWNVWQSGTSQTIQWTDSAAANNVYYTVFVGQKNGSAYGYGIIADQVYGTKVPWNVGTLADGSKLPPLASGESAYYIQVVRQTPPQATSFTTSPNASFTITSATTPPNQNKLIISLDSNTPIAISIPAGSAGQVIAAFKFQAPAQSHVTIGSVSLTDFVNSNAAVSGDLKNYSLWDGSTQIGQTVPATITPPSGVTPGSMEFLNLRWIIPAGSSKVLAVKADVSSTAASNRHAIQLSGFSFTEGISSNWEQGPFTASSFSIAGTNTAPTASLTQSLTTTVAGNPYSISWNSSNVTSCTVDGSRNGETPIVYQTTTSGGPWTISPVVVGTHVWRINCTGPNGPASATFTHTVTSATTPTITVLSPNGGEMFAAGGSYPLEKQIRNWPTNGKLMLALTSEAGVHTYLGDITNISFSTLNISSNINPGKYKVRLFCNINGTENFCSPDGTLATNSGAQDYSDSYFTITSTTPAPTASITIVNNTKPNGDPHNVTLTVGDNNTKTWASTNGTSWSSLVTYSGSCASNSYGTNNTPYTWVAGNTASGSATSAGALASNAGCTTTITYTVTGPGGTASDYIRATTVAAPGGASALNALNSAMSAGASQTTTTRITFTLDLYRGESGAEVSALQTALKAEELFSADVSGEFFDQTREAVMAFQTKYGIPATGYVGSATRAKLNELYSK